MVRALACHNGSYRSIFISGSKWEESDSYHQTDITQNRVGNMYFQQIPPFLLEYNASLEKDKVWRLLIRKIKKIPKRKVVLG